MADGRCTVHLQSGRQLDNIRAAIFDDCRREVARRLSEESPDAPIDPSQVRLHIGTHEANYREYIPSIVHHRITATVTPLEGVEIRLSVAGDELAYFMEPGATFGTLQIFVAELLSDAYPYLYGQNVHLSQITLHIHEREVNYSDRIPARCGTICATVSDHDYQDKINSLHDAPIRKWLARRAWTEADTPAFSQLVSAIYGMDQREHASSSSSTDGSA